MVLTASFGEAIVGLRNAFVNRLNGRVVSVRLKIAIIELLTTCVETQPGIIESFSHLVSEKNETTLGRFSCLTPLLDILMDTKHINVISSTVMDFIAALWMNRYDVAMQVIKKRFVRDCPSYLVVSLWYYYCLSPKVFKIIGSSRLRNEFRIQKRKL